MNIYHHEHLLVTSCVGTDGIEPLCCKAGDSSLLSLVLFVSFIMAGQDVFKEDLEIISVNKVEWKQILIKMKENSFY